MKKYRIRELRHFNEEIARQVMLLHFDVFGATADIPLPWPGRKVFWWLVWHGKKLVGFACLKRAASVPCGGYLSRSGVHEDHRGHGLQRRLIKARERKARKLWYDVLFSDTIANPPSSRNLEACGFSEFIPASPWGAKGARYFKKELTA